MSLIKVNKNENPYHIIGEYIEKHITYVDDIIAVISLDGNIINELFLVEITTESNFIWQNDWWEGEENVELIDFFFVSDACKRYDNNDLISRQAAIDVMDSETVSTNPEHFKSSEKFIKFMNNVDIASFGKWQWANGFNTALVVARIQLEKLPFAQLEIVRCKDCKHYKYGICKKAGLCVNKSPNGFCDWTERREVTE